MDFQSLTSHLLSKFRTLYDDALIAFHADSKTIKGLQP